MKLLFFRVYGAIGVLFCVALCVAVLLLVGLPLMLIPKRHRWKFGIWLNIGLGSFFLRLYPLFCRVEKEGVHTIPRSKGFLAICNHLSAVDVPLVLADTRAHGISKRAVLYFPGMGQIGYLGGALFFDRRSPAARRRVLKKAIALMKAGQPLHVYPQGTRLREGRKPKVHKGLIVACHSAGIPVLPTAIARTDQLVPHDVDIRPFRRVRVSYLPPVDPKDFEKAEEFADFCWQQVEDEVARITDS